MIDLFNPWIFPATVVITLATCRGLDSYYTELKRWIFTRLGIYQKCEDCRGLGILATGKKRFRKEKH